MNPSFLLLPSPKQYLTKTLFGIQKAVTLGYEGVGFGIGTNAIQDPAKTDWSNFTTAVKLAASHKLRLRLRLGQNVPRQTFSGGVPTGSSVWVSKYNAGKTWDRPYLIPAAVAKAVALLVWDKAWAIASSAYSLAGLDPLTYIECEGINEPGEGGVGGAFKGDKKPTYPGPEWNLQYPEGTILPATWTMLRTLLSNCHIPVSAMRPFTLEGAHGDVGKTEALSVAGPDAAWIVATYPKIFVNRYLPPCQDLYYATTLWTSYWEAEMLYIRANPKLATVGVAVMEAGAAVSKVPSGADVGLYRREVLKAARVACPAGLFICQATNSQDTGFDLYKADGTPIGSEVGPVKL